MTLVLGCDASKRQFDISLVDSSGVEWWHTTVVNDVVELGSFLLTVAGGYPDEELCCAVESTGTYHGALVEACRLAAVPCRLLNPLLTKQQIKTTIRGKKTDHTDALAIARLGLRGEGYVQTPEPYPTAKAVVRSIQKLSQLQGSYAAHRLHVAEQAEATLSDRTSTALQDIRTAIAAARTQLSKDLTAAVAGETFRRLQTIPGVGPYVAASLLAELQTMERFGKTCQLVAYAGLDPRIKQSGQTLNRTGSLTKRGSSHLRRSLFIAASIARQYDPTFKALYDKKRAEGKPYTVATLVVARKLLRIIRVVWLSGQAYDAQTAAKG